MSTLVTTPSATASRTVSVTASAYAGSTPALVSAFTAAWASKVATVVAQLPRPRQQARRWQRSWGAWWVVAPVRSSCMFPSAAAYPRPVCRVRCGVKRNAVPKHGVKTTGCGDGSMDLNHLPIPDMPTAPRKRPLSVAPAPCSGKRFPDERHDACCGTVPVPDCQSRVRPAFVRPRRERQGGGAWRRPDSRPAGACS